MLPIYKKKPITEERLTEEVMIEALEREDVAVSSGTARQVCLLLTQLNSTMKSFEAELFSDPYHKEYPAREMANFLTRDIEEILRSKEAANYKEEFLTSEKTAAAMNQAGIRAEVGLMESMLAAYAVGGRELLAEEWLAYLVENHLTVDSITTIARYY